MKKHEFIQIGSYMETLRAKASKFKENLVEEEKTRRKDIIEDAGVVDKYSKILPTKFRSEFGIENDDGDIGGVDTFDCVTTLTRTLRNLIKKIDNSLKGTAKHLLNGYMYLRRKLISVLVSKSDSDYEARDDEEVIVFDEEKKENPEHSRRLESKFTLAWLQ